MSESSEQLELSTAEERVLQMNARRWHGTDVLRICLSQLRSLETNDRNVAAAKQRLEFASAWDYEDYDEATQGAKPEGSDRKADVLVCGIGNCTLRICTDSAGNELQSGECRADDYCLKEQFEAVRKTATPAEGRALYREVLETCEFFAGSTSAGSFCPKLDCELSAGVSIDGIPGTDGRCVDGR